MKKLLLLLRHGQAESGGGKADFERLLNNKGLIQTRAIACWLKKKEFSPKGLSVHPLTVRYLLLEGWLPLFLWMKMRFKLTIEYMRLV